MKFGAHGVSPVSLDETDTKRVESELMTVILLHVQAITDTRNLMRIYL